MKLFKILAEGRYLITTVIATIAMLVFFPMVQSLGNPGIWFTFIAPLNFVLYLIFSALFGITVAVQYYSFVQKTKACGIKGAGGNVGSLLGIFAFQCPACLPVLGQVLGLNTVIFLATYKTQLILVGIGSMLLSLYLLGAFKNE